MDVLGDETETAIPVNVLHNCHCANEEHQDFTRLTQLLEHFLAQVGVVSRE